MVAKPDNGPTPRERLCAAASELFYAEGIHTVGIDRLIERAGVAKATLYSSFGGKDQLVKAYLEQRHEMLVGWLSTATESDAPPREKLLAVFDVLRNLMADPTYRGCPFVAASAESPDEGVRQASDMHRRWVRTMFERLAAEAGAIDPPRLGRQLVLLYDGALVGAHMDRDGTAAGVAKEVAATILDAATVRRPT